jgi:hypothetical protein
MLCAILPKWFLPARGERPQDRRYTVPQVLSTLYRTVGVDPAQTFLNGTGRPIHILDDREPVRELLVEENGNLSQRQSGVPWRWPVFPVGGEPGAQA